ncbi:MAG: type-F conjugative transfer system pilin assembly protein TrbC [Rickettsia endosymbiont of Ixodes persulcatus]|nr:type-F conjugative transfer system pilin assembly protein TrbC [Rickettsia endosymbiont of Ixodes persulcatus]MCZ6902714.1 type-F conjugative transfer system pilin assembly protein TrbC [Rickettsia endosymbiont of Ixodes persulcatus]MCZ6908930.1 type-F conjugative transfer system pilin assembly protein TrbC [Rickettsia endosymbiont of Ixodes persulcatus]MCZ6914609.1 type-F conjugative transfer system pilin assembly protein TrbC [Rickettsia endosymbiont of Ixodes persulcatus]MCZ6919022.1 type
MQFNLKTIILTCLLILGSTSSLAQPEVLLHNIVQPKLETKTYNQIYIFVSFSMPDSALKSYYIEAEQAGAKLVMRGLKNNSFLDTKAKADEINISFNIDPNLFEEYQITSVPAIIVNSEGKGVKRLTGHISLHDALEIMNKENS